MFVVLFDPDDDDCLLGIAISSTNSPLPGLLTKEETKDYLLLCWGTIVFDVPDELRLTILLFYVASPSLIPKEGS